MTEPIIISVPTKRTNYVALDLDTNEIIAHGMKRKTVIAKAKKSNHNNYSIMFVPKQGINYIF